MSEGKRTPAAGVSGESRAAKRRRKDKDRSSSGKPLQIDAMSLPTSSEATASSFSINNGEYTAAANIKNVPLGKLLATTDPTYDTLAKEVMQNLVYPTDCELFYDTCWKTSPLLAARGDDAYFKPLPNKKSLEKTLQEHALTLNKDIGLRKSGEVYEEDKEGTIITSKQVWKLFEEGYVVELEHPQKYFDKFWHFISLLEIEFGSSVVPSIIIAPSGAQCFAGDLLAEHADTIVLQLAGSCKWALTGPGDKGGGQKLSLTETSQCGDTLYIPPEWSLSCSATIGEEAILCVMRTNHDRSMLNLSEMVAKQSINKMMNDKRRVNTPLPRDLFSFMGVAHSEEDEDPRRMALTANAKKLMEGLITNAVDMLDAATDQIAKDFVSSRTPITLTDEEERLSYAGGGRDIKLFPYSKIKMIRPGVAITVVEDGHVFVYHCMENSRDPAETLLCPIEFELDDGPAIEEILMSYPKGVTISELSHSSEEMDDKVEIARALFREGFLMVVDEASKPAEEGESDDDDCPF